MRESFRASSLILMVASVLLTEMFGKGVNRHCGKALTCVKIISCLYGIHLYFRASRIIHEQMAGMRGLRVVWCCSSLGLAKQIICCFLAEWLWATMQKIKY